MAMGWKMDVWKVEVFTYGDLETQTHSPDCNGYPTARCGKCCGARSSSGKRDKAPKKLLFDEFEISDA